MTSDRSEDVGCRFKRCRHAMPRVWQSGCEAHCYLHRQAIEASDRIRVTFDL
jgi:hypothetical protein